MADTETTLEAIAHALRQASSLTAIKGVHTRELDLEGTDANLEFPLIELQPVSETQGDIGFVEYIYDDAGNEIGEIYEWAATVRVQIDIWTISGSNHDAVNLGDALEMTLFRYADGGYNDPLPDGSGGAYPEINLEIDSGSTANSRALSGGTVFLRRWRQDVIATYTRRVSTLSEYGPLPYIKDVHTPRDGDFHGTGEPREVEAEPPYPWVTSQDTSTDSGTSD